MAEHARMGIYDDSAFAVGADIASVHEAQLQELGGPGTWFTGAQRVAIAEQARAARAEAGLYEAIDTDGRTSPGVMLAEAAVRVARQVAVQPQTLSRAFVQQALDDGLTDAEYVEIVAIVARIVDYDIFARGLGIPARQLPEPVGGIPSKERPALAEDEGAFVATVPGGPGAEYIYGSAEPQAGIIRSASLVPAEARAQRALEEAQYLPLARFPQWDYQHHEGLTRPQVEVVAGRISDFHDCFY